MIRVVCSLVVVVFFVCVAVVFSVLCFVCNGMCLVLRVSSCLFFVVGELVC